MKHCETCRWWYQPRAAIEVGRFPESMWPCMKITWAKNDFVHHGDGRCEMIEQGREAGSALLYAEDVGGPQIVTDARFGCVLHEERSS